MRNYERSLVAMALGAGLLTGCVGRVRQPEIALTGVKLGGIGLRGGTLIAQLEIKNPNRFDVETANITYDLKVSDSVAGTSGTSGKESWIDFAKGTFEEKVKIDEGRTTIVEIPIQFTYASAGSAIRSIMDRGTFDYQVQGTVALREPLRREIPYRHKGNISLQGVK
jgi:LEA14-like dessication related protein